MTCVFTISPTTHACYSCQTTSSILKSVYGRFLPTLLSIFGVTNFSLMEVYLNSVSDSNLLFIYRACAQEKEYFFGQQLLILVEIKDNSYIMNSTFAFEMKLSVNEASE